MPITDIGSYVTTGQEFEAHWTSVNDDRTANTLPEFALPDGFDLAALSTAVADLQTAISGIEDLDNAFDLAATDRDNLKQTLRDRIVEFRDTV